MAGSPTLLPESRLGSTLRRDAWWVEILPVIILLGGFGLYATLRAFEGAYYAWGPYLSPFYSPLIDPSHHWWPWSPALLILGGPLGFRATCYYYRKAYYRSFFLDPPSCAVGEPSKRKYKGETKFPFILQNLHRYFFYIAVVFLAFLWYDAIVAYDWNGHFGIGVGTLIMSVNIIMLTLYTFSCHSLRHLAGGKLDCFSCATFGMPRHSAWSGISFLNERHMLLAWTSLITVGFTDFYIRMVAAGVFHDLRIL
ncbi:MAG: hypothetical protein WCA40_16870 [Candidatus Acidiferrum sp.]